MYIDHEASPFYWEGESHSVAHLVKLNLFSFQVQRLYFQVMGVNVSSLDYALSDY